MFAYCGNNPINRADSTGASWYNTVNDFIQKTQAHDKAMNEFNESREVHRSSGSSLRICTDGATDNYNSQSHQSETAMSGRLKVKTPADEIPYVVIPTNHPNYDKMIGCMSIVIDHSTGKYVYAVIGDGGPSKNGYGEVSLKVAWDLGYSEKEANGARGPSGKFTIILFPGTRQNWNSNNLYDQIQETGNSLFPWKKVR